MLKIKFFLSDLVSKLFILETALGLLFWTWKIAYLTSLSLGRSGSWQNFHTFSLILMRLVFYFIFKGTVCFKLSIDFLGSFYNLSKYMFNFW